MVFLLQSLLFLLAIGSIFVQGGQQLVFTNVTFSSDQKYMNFSVWLNESRVSTIITAREDIIGVTIDFKLFVNTDGTNGEFINFVTKQVDFCQVLDNPISDPLFNMVFQTIIINMNNHFFRKCPLTKVSE